MLAYFRIHSVIKDITLQTHRPRFKTWKRNSCSSLIAVDKKWEVFNFYLKTNENNLINEIIKKLPEFSAVVFVYMYFILFFFSNRTAIIGTARYCGQCSSASPPGRSFWKLRRCSSASWALQPNAIRHREHLGQSKKFREDASESATGRGSRTSRATSLLSWRNSFASHWNHLCRWLCPCCAAHDDILWGSLKQWGHECRPLKFTWRQPC